MELSTVVAVGLIAVVLHFLYRYLTEPYKYWKERGVQSAPTVPILGSLVTLLGKPLHFTMRERYEKYGAIYGQYEGRRPTITVSDPELLRNILVKDFQFFTNRRDFRTGDPVFDNMITVLRGEKWKRVRTIMTPAFTTGKIKKMSSIFLDAAKSLKANMENAIDAGKPIDCKRLYGAFTMDVIASSAFGTKIDSHNDPDNPFVTAARKVFSRNIPWRIVLFFMFPLIFKLLGLRVLTPGPMKFFSNATMEIIKERRRTGKVANDFLQLMMDSADETFGKNGTNIAKEEVEEFEHINAEDIAHEKGNEQISKVKDYKGLTYNEMLAQCIIFFLAGYDTTASTLSFVSYMLALNPDCQDTLIAEIDDVLRNNNNELTYDGVQSMKYLDLVISETLRLYPAAIGLEREADVDYKLGDTGITIPKGMIIAINTYGMHYNPEFYPDPDKFNPQRFTPEEIAKRSPYTYLPFGHGPRNCLGMRFAQMEIKFCLSYIFSQFRVKRSPKTKVPLEYFVGQALLAPKEVVVQLERRTDKVCSFD